MNNYEQIVVEVNINRMVFIRTNVAGEMKLVARMDFAQHEMVFYDANEVDVLTLGEAELKDDKITPVLDKEWGVPGFGTRIGKAFMEAAIAYSRAAIRAMLEQRTAEFKTETFIYEAPREPTATQH